MAENIYLFESIEYAFIMRGNVHQDDETKKIIFSVKPKGFFKPTIFVNNIPDNLIMQPKKLMTISREGKIIQEQNNFIRIKHDILGNASYEDLNPKTIEENYSLRQQVLFLSRQVQWLKDRLRGTADQDRFNKMVEDLAKQSGKLKNHYWSSGYSGFDSFGGQGFQRYHPGGEL